VGLDGHQRLHTLRPLVLNFVTCACACALNGKSALLHASKVIKGCIHCVRVSSTL
jgi:hypothetical protein